MKIIIKRDRDIDIIGVPGIVGENKVVVLNFEFPKEVSDYIKYIEFDTGDEKTFDVIENNTYEITRVITQHEKVDAQVVCKSEMENDTKVWKTDKFVLEFGESINAESEIKDDGRIDIINTILTQVKTTQEKTEELEKNKEEAETIRVNNENERINAEKQREEKTTEAVKEIDNKTEEYNKNAETKTNDFNSNYNEKLEDFNTNATNITNVFNDNVKTQADVIETLVSTKKTEIEDLSENSIKEINIIKNSIEIKLANGDYKGNKGDTGADGRDGIDGAEYDDTEIKQKVDNLEESQTIQNTSINQNTSDLYKIKEMLTKTVEGEEITVEDSSTFDGKLNIKDGAMEQEVTETSPSLNYPSEIKTLTGDTKINVVNRNWFDELLELGSIDNSTGKNSISNDCMRSKNFTSVLSNSDYTIWNNRDYANYIYEYDKDENFIKYTSNLKNPFSFTTSLLTKYIKVRTIASTFQNSLDTQYLLEKGSSVVKENHISRKSQSYQISLRRFRSIHRKFISKTRSKMVFKKDHVKSNIRWHRKLDNNYNSYNRKK